jgi:hypothetical protein
VRERLHHVFFAAGSLVRAIVQGSSFMAAHTTMHSPPQTSTLQANLSLALHLTR